MSSLRNKNKKKGFKLSMANPIPQKIIFSANEPANGAQIEGTAPRHEAGVAMLDSSPEQTLSSHVRQPRLVPPSELQERGQIPANMFVTSVDVEAGMWDNTNTTQQSSKRRSRKKAKSQNEDEYYAQNWYGQDESLATEDASVVLSYSEADPTPSINANANASYPSTSEQFDWDQAERVWDKSVAVSSLDQLVVGGIVAWKVRRSFLPLSFACQLTRVLFSGSRN